MPQILNYETIFYSMDTIINNKKYKNILCYKENVLNLIVPNKKFSQGKNFSAEIFKAFEKKMQS